MPKAVIYSRVSTADQHAEAQVFDLEQLAIQRGFTVVERYVDVGISGTRARRPALDHLLADARRGRFDVVLVWAVDRLARSTRHFLEVLDELNRCRVQFLSFRENLDTGGALGRAVIIIVSAIAELERSLIVERVRAGLRRARIQGQRLGRRPLPLDRDAIVHDHEQGLSLAQLAIRHHASRTTMHRIVKCSKIPAKVDEVSGCQ